MPVSVKQGWERNALAGYAYFTDGEYQTTEVPELLWGDPQQTHVGVHDCTGEALVPVERI